MITIFTPAYNRAYILSDLWESLKAQDNFSFEWLIVDDGSTDETEKLVNHFISNTSEFPINYIKKENGGKHRAINLGVKSARGELFFIVDSDDKLPPKAVSTILYYYSGIFREPAFAGLAGCKHDFNGNLIGTTFPAEYIDATSFERDKLGISGDKAEVFLTEILKKYPFPEFENENFLSEAVVWNKIAADGYKLRWFNADIYHCEYLNDGLTYNLRKNYRKNPIGYLTYVGQEMKFQNIGFLKKMIWTGRCKETIKGLNIEPETIKKLLSITNLEYNLSSSIYFIYKIFKKIVKN